MIEVERERYGEIEEQLTYIIQKKGVDGTGRSVEKLT